MGVVAMIPPVLHDVMSLPVPPNPHVRTNTFCKLIKLLYIALPNIFSIWPVLPAFGSSGVLSVVNFP